MKIYRYAELSLEEKNAICKREKVSDDKVIKIVQDIKKRITEDKDKAIIELTYEFDKVRLDNIKVSQEEIQKAYSRVDEDLKKAINIAKNNIEKFHKFQLNCLKSEKVETTNGIYCYRKFLPIENVGLYIPNGSAPLFSTVLMLAIPAKIAGCKEIIMCSPANKNGEIAPEILYCADICGVKNIYKVGGAQAIYAMAYSTQTIKKVDKIFGPGNQFVVNAKMDVSSICSIDMPAGPSEVLVVADKTSNPKFVASDILAQAEHGASSQSVLVLSDEEKLAEIIKEIEEQTQKLSRKEIVEQSLKNSFVVLTNSVEESMDFSNIYAPEHLILNFENYEKYIDLIKNAGSVFLGKYSSESFGDYASGTNHTLPTSGFAKSYSGLNIESFGKQITFQEVSKKGFDNLADTVEIMAKKEQLDAHYNSVSIRRNDEK